MSFDILPNHVGIGAGVSDFTLLIVRLDNCVSALISGMVPVIFEPDRDSTDRLDIEAMLAGIDPIRFGAATCNLVRAVRLTIEVGKVEVDITEAGMITATTAFPTHWKNNGELQSGGLYVSAAELHPQLVRSQ